MRVDGLSLEGTVGILLHVNTGLICECYEGDRAEIGSSFVEKITTGVKYPD